MGGIEMQIFLLVNALILGALLMAAFLFFRAHRLSKKETEREKLQPLMPHATWQKIVSDAEKEYNKTIRQATTELQKELRSNTTTLHKKATAISIKIINEEFSRYKNDLAKIHRESADMLQSTSKDIAKQSIDMRNNLITKQNIVELRLNEQQARLEKQLLDQQQNSVARQAALDLEIDKIAATKQQQRLQQIDTRLNDAVTSFLIENLGADVDLGAQLPHLLNTLEQNKEDIKKELR